MEGGGLFAARQKNLLEFLSLLRDLRVLEVSGFADAADRVHLNLMSKAKRPGESLDLIYTAKQRKIKETVRDFAEAEISHESEDEVLSKGLLQKMSRLNLFGLQLPEEYGGAALDTVCAAICVEELSRVSASAGLCVSVHNSVSAYPILAYGTEDQKRKFLPDLASGKSIGAFCLTEPNAGSDPSSIESRAVRDVNGDFVVNGQKAYVTNGGIAGTCLIFAKTGDDSRSGMSVVIAEWGAKGFTRGALEDMCGMRGNPVCSLFFSDVVIPAGNLLGKEGGGFRVAMTALDAGRIGIGAQGVGIAQAALDAALKYSNERVQFGKPLSAQQTVQNYLAEMAVNIEAARMLVFRAASLKDAGKPFTKEAAMAKYFATKTAMESTTTAVQIHGAYGYSRGFLVERYFRDAKVTEIYEGANEIQRLVIARSLLEELGRTRL